MALKHNLLAMLSQKSQTGYDLYKSIFEPVRPERSIIYRQLNEMKKHGLVSFVRIEQTKYPARKVFSITEAGRHELNNWYKEPDRLFLHDPLWAQIWYGNCVDKETLISLINKYVDYIDYMRTYYIEHAVPFITKMLSIDANRRDYFYWRLVLELGDELTTSYRKWAEEIVQKIDEFDESDTRAQPLVKDWVPKKAPQNKSRKKK